MMMRMKVMMMKVKLNVSVKCNTKPFAEPQFEVNQEKGIFLHYTIRCDIHCTLQCNIVFSPLYNTMSVQYNIIFTALYNTM